MLNIMKGLVEMDKHIQFLIYHKFKININSNKTIPIEHHADTRAPPSLCRHKCPSVRDDSVSLGASTVD